MEREIFLKREYTHVKCEKGHWVSFPAKGEHPMNLGKKNNQIHDGVSGFAARDPLSFPADSTVLCYFGISTGTLNTDEGYFG